MELDIGPRLHPEGGTPRFDAPVQSHYPLTAPRAEATSPLP